MQQFHLPHFDPPSHDDLWEFDLFWRWWWNYQAVTPKYKYIEMRPHLTWLMVWRRMASMLIDPGIRRSGDAVIVITEFWHWDTLPSIMDVRWLRQDGVLWHNSSTTPGNWWGMLCLCSQSGFRPTTGCTTRSTFPYRLSWFWAVRQWESYNRPCSCRSGIWNNLEQICQGGDAGDVGETIANRRQGDAQQSNVLGLDGSKQNPIIDLLTQLVAQQNHSSRSQDSRCSRAGPQKGVRWRDGTPPSPPQWRNSADLRAFARWERKVELGLDESMHAAIRCGTHAVYAVVWWSGTGNRTFGWFEQSEFSWWNQVYILWIPFESRCSRSCCFRRGSCCRTTSTFPGIQTNRSVNLQTDMRASARRERFVCDRNISESALLLFMIPSLVVTGCLTVHVWHLICKDWFPLALAIHWCSIQRVSPWTFSVRISNQVHLLRVPATPILRAKVKDQVPLLRLHLRHLLRALR